MRVAVLGATGAVGRTMLKLLAGRPWLDGDPLCLASARSQGAILPWAGRDLICRAVDADAFAGVDIALFSAGGEASRRWAPVAAAVGTWVVDNSSAFRMDPAVPLIVPEINGGLAPVLPTAAGGVIANPNCSTIQVALAMAPLERAFGLREVHVTTLQAVSGAGQKGVDELMRQSTGDQEDCRVFGRPIVGNVVPAIGRALPDGSYEEEDKVLRELRKILGRDESLAVTCTATRVPVVNGHSAAVRVVLARPVARDAVLAALQAWPGLRTAGDPHDFCTPREADGDTLVHVGRLRRDPGDPCAWLMWVVADNLLKGAAWNAVQIADLLAGAEPER